MVDKPFICYGEVMKESKQTRQISIPVKWHNIFKCYEFGKILYFRKLVSAELFCVGSVLAFIEFLNAYFLHFLC